ncbi:MAG: A/G-specific adenine glycosylase [Candidatus Dormibacteria bacterium]
MWTRGLASWYGGNGRHGLPWRQTRDPWAVLVSEVMLQQTQVARVIPYWERFLTRWPDAAAFTRAPLADVLREWQGLGYPRRARNLWLAAARIERDGWPRTEAALRALPGVGMYTARALLALAFDATSAPPLDVNIARVAARAALGAEPHAVSRRSIEAAIDGARPRNLGRREYTFALFDAGALHCRATPRCSGCPLSRGCVARSRSAVISAARRRSQHYDGTMRQLRGALLAASLKHKRPLTAESASAAAAHLQLGRDRSAVVAALDSLRRDGLIAPTDG